MFYNDFTDRPTASRRQHRNEPMKLAVQPQLVKDLSPITLESTIVIMKLDAGQSTDKLIENARRINLVPGVVSLLLPTAGRIPVS